MYVGRGAGGIHAHSGKEFNRVNASDPASEAVYVDDHGYNVSPGAPARRSGDVWASCMPNVANCTDLCPPSTRADDPCHGMSCVTEQIYGYAKPVGVAAEPTMTGFVQNAAGIKHNISNPMSMFTPTSAPIIRWGGGGGGARAVARRCGDCFPPAHARASRVVDACAAPSPKSSPCSTSGSATCRAPRSQTVSSFTQRRPRAKCPTTCPRVASHRSLFSTT